MSTLVVIAIIVMALVMISANYIRITEAQQHKKVEVTKERITQIRKILEEDKKAVVKKEMSYEEAKEAYEKAKRDYLNNNSDGVGPVS